MGKRAIINHECPRCEWSFARRDFDRAPPHLECSNCGLVTWLDDDEPIRGGPRFYARDMALIAGFAWALGVITGVTFLSVVT